MITTPSPPIVITIGDSTAPGEARRAATALAGRLGFDETERGRVAIVATELATNLHKHATDGEVILQGLESGTDLGVDILAIDRGPGMANVERCMADGFSTAGSSGAGLSGIARLSTMLEVYSLPGVGTAAMARIWSGQPPRAQSRPGVEFGAISIPVAGEEVCGDHWAIEEAEGRIVVLVVDGLGHGPQAAEAARNAVLAFRETASSSPSVIMQAAHAALRTTRGAALAIARIDPDRGEVCYAGVGNIVGTVTDPAKDLRLSMVSHNGIVGHAIRKVQEFVYPWTSHSLLIMHSDGLGSQWQLGRYPNLVNQHPGLIPVTLYRDYKRVRDDVTVVAAREGRASL